MKKDFVIIRIVDGGIDNIKGIVNLFVGVPDGKYIVERSRYNKRSNQQNRYLHGLLIPELKNALRYAGYDEVRTDEQAKDIMKNMFLKVHTTNINTGEVIEYTKHTSELTKAETNELIDAVIKFCAESLNYPIAYPNEQMNLYED